MPHPTNNNGGRVPNGANGTNGANVQQTTHTNAFSGHANYAALPRLSSTGTQSFNGAPAPPQIQNQFISRFSERRTENGQLPASGQNGHQLNGHTNGLANGHTPGQQANGQPNGHR